MIVKIEWSTTDNLVPPIFGDGAGHVYRFR
jgi:hypothetical protein